MSFKRVEINGFKSFADRTEIRFTNGVTGIVGPNGCGKSNVADAIRFCLGEGSSKSLRGGKMNDVIFAGTEKRKSLSFCEVSLYFNNKDRIFKDLDYDEVVFTRKLFRDNESEYYINKTLCRKADILDALRDSGVGKEGYSIIGQGKVEELISSKPVDRRAIFDEAAGISKYKHRKNESQNKIRKANDSLSRINDLLAYTSNSLKPLITEANNARKYKEQFEKLKHYEINIYLHQFETTNETKAIILGRKNDIVLKINETQQKYDEATSAYSKAMSEFNGIDDTLTKLNEQLVEASVSHEKSQGDISSKRQSIQYIKAQIEQFTEEINGIESDLAVAQNELNDSLEKMDACDRDYRSKKVALDEKEKKFNEIVTALSELEGAEKERNQSLIDAIERLSEINANMSTLLANKDNYNESIAQSKGRISEYRDNLEAAKALFNDKSQEYSDTLTKLAASKKKLAELGEALESNQKKLGTIATTIRSVDSDLTSCQAYVDFYNKMTASGGNLENSVQALLMRSKENTEIKKRIEGVVGKLLEVPEKYEVAIETALGAAIQHIVTPTSDDAAYLINYLKTNQLGRATFLPMTDIKPREVYGDFSSVISSKGCYGIASELVTFDSKYSNIFSNLLAGTLIVDDIYVGLEIARKTRYSFRIVTLDGDIIHQRGSMTGGSRSAVKSSFFANERSYKENKEKLVKLKSQKESLESERKELENKIREITADSLNETKISNNLSVSEASLKLIVERAAGDIKSAAAQIEFEENDIRDKQSKIDKITAEIDSVDILKKTIDDAKNNASSTKNENEGKINELKLLRDSLGNEVTLLKVEVTTLENRIRAIRADYDRASFTINSLNNKLSLDKNSLSNNQSSLEQANLDLQKLLLDVTEGDRSTSINDIRLQISDFNNYKNELKIKIDEYNASREKCTAILNELGEKKTNEELMLQKVDTDLETMTDRVTNTYNLDYESCKEFRDPEFEPDSWIEEAGRLTRSIARLGEVHLDSIERLETMNKEYSELERQRDDVIRAIKGEEKIIENLSKEMKSIFNEKFEQINLNFKKTFRELFNGGTAELLILPLEEDQTDELDAGIEIVAQPPSKALQRLSLLSGGEKALTAIAILFAILQLRPMPFCVLDEIEAALDDANALRFAKYLKRFSNETQFIVITHRKPTMELCDSLYGVTMEEKGVTKLVSVSLSDATKFID